MATPNVFEGARTIMLRLRAEKFTPTITRLKSLVGVERKTVIFGLLALVAALVSARQVRSNPAENSLEVGPRHPEVIWLLDSEMVGLTAIADGVDGHLSLTFLCRSTDGVETTGASLQHAIRSDQEKQKLDVKRSQTEARERCLLSEWDQLGVKFDATTTMSLELFTPKTSENVVLWAWLSIALAVTSTYVLVARGVVRKTTA